MPFLLILLACKDPPQAPIVGPGVPVATTAAPRWPKELLGSWSSLDDLDGRWVVSTPCNRAASVLEFADAPGAGRMHWSHGVTNGDWTLTAVTEEAVGWRVVLQSGTETETHLLHFLDPSQQRLALDETGPFIRAAEAAWVEHIYQSPADCGNTQDSPWGSLSGAPEQLWRLVWMDGSWRRPPDAGTSPELSFSTAATPPEIHRRNGAGERVYPLVSARREGDVFWLTVEDGADHRLGVDLRPWVAPPTGLPALPDLPSGPSRPAAPAAPTTPPPAGAFLVTFGPEGLDPGSAWVPELPR